MNHWPPTRSWPIADPVELAKARDEAHVAACLRGGGFARAEIDERGHVEHVRPPRYTNGHGTR